MVVSVGDESRGRKVRRGGRRGRRGGRIIQGTRQTQKENRYNVSILSIRT